MKCLVVDDSAITRRILVNSLRMIGFKGSSRPVTASPR